MKSNKSLTPTVVVGKVFHVRRKTESYFEERVSSGDGEFGQPLLFR